jgi:ppGpp synthetase/RelA/SpoT-type nucleotidyltranferase
MANRSKETAHDITHAELVGFMFEMRQALATAEEAAQIAEKPGKIAVFNYSSYERSLERVRSFVKGLNESLQAVRKNAPFVHGQLRPSVQSRIKKGETIPAKTAKATIDRKTTKKK